LLIVVTACNMSAVGTVYLSIAVDEEELDRLRGKLSFSVWDLMVLLFSMVSIEAKL